MAGTRLDSAACLSTRPAAIGHGHSHEPRRHHKRPDRVVVRSSEGNRAGHGGGGMHEILGCQYSALPPLRGVRTCMRRRGYAPRCCAGARLAASPPSSSWERPWARPRPRRGGRWGTAAPRARAGLHVGHNISLHVRFRAPTGCRTDSRGRRQVSNPDFAALTAVRPQARRVR